MHKVREVARGERWCSDPSLFKDKGQALLTTTMSINNWENVGGIQYGKIYILNRLYFLNKIWKKKRKKVKKIKKQVLRLICRIDVIGDFDLFSRKTKVLIFSSCQHIICKHIHACCIIPTVQISSVLPWFLGIVVLLFHQHLATDFDTSPLQILISMTFSYILPFIELSEYLHKLEQWKDSFKFFS